jgi:hypothetical protein
MEIEGRGAAPAGPSSAVAELTSAAAEPEPRPELVAQPRSWIRPIGDYAQHELARPEDASSYG